MDRNKTTRPGAQIGFIKFVLIPLFETLRPAFGAVVDEHMVTPLRDSADRFIKMSEEEKQQAAASAAGDIISASNPPSAHVSHSQLPKEMMRASEAVIKEAAEAAEAADAQVQMEVELKKEGKVRCVVHVDFEPATK